MILPPAALLFPPAIVRQVATVAPNAGAPGQSDAAASSVPNSTTPPRQSLNRGNLPSPAVPGGTSHAPNRGPKNQSFSKPIQRD